MRDIVSCFSENAVNVSQYSSCSSYRTNPCITNPNLSPSIQNSVSSIYKLILSSLKQILVTITWCSTHSNQGLTITFDGSDPFRLNTNSRFLRKKKGSKLLELSDSKVEIFWDLSNAKYESGPEPVLGFYVVILVDSEIGLVIGDAMAEESVSKKLRTNKTVSKSTLLSRREHCSGNTIYTTKAQFCENGTFHDVLIRCSVENDEEGLKQRNPVLSVSIDKKTVIRVKRLQWNFRGNQTIFVDGLLVDLLWDVHDWFFNNSNSSSSSSSNSNSSGYAVFMFRTRSGLDSRLWLEEKSANQDDNYNCKDRIEFSLLIYACKSS